MVQSRFVLSSPGLVVDLHEVLCAESLSQRYCFMARLKSRWPELQVVCHDDACHLKLFCIQHRRSSETAEQLAQMAFIVDRFHAPGHTGAYCKEHCMPQLELNRGLLRNFPTDIAETVNSEFSPLGHTIHHMGRFFAQLVVHESADVHNLSRLLASKDRQRAQSKKCARVAWLVVKPSVPFGLVKCVCVSPLQFPNYTTSNAFFVPAAAMNHYVSGSCCLFVCYSHPAINSANLLRVLCLSRSGIWSARRRRASTLTCAGKKKGASS